MKKLLLALALALFLGCSQKSPGVLVDKPVWPYELYEKLNLRTFLNSYNNALRFYCASYPKDFYLPEQVYMPDADTIVMENNVSYLSFKFVTDNHIIMVDGLKDGTLKIERSVLLYYNEDADEYRSDTFFIKARDNCVNYVIAKDKNTTQTEKKVTKNSVPKSDN